VSAIIGVDVGGSTMSGGLVSSEGDVLSALHRPTRGGGRAAAPETLLNLIAELASDAAARGLPLEGVGIGLPGLVHPEKGMMVAVSNLVPEFAGIPLADRVRKETGVPAFVDNDVSALALGEWMFGPHRALRSLVVLAIGSGVGGGMILAGQLVRGHHGYAGEWGHVPIDFGGASCICGGRGCLATFIAGESLAREARDRVPRESGAILLELAGGDPGAITAKTIFQAARAGDPLATGMVERACRALGAGLAALVNGVNPEAILVTGGVVSSLVPLEGAIRRWVAAYALAEPLADTAIHLMAGDKSRSMRGAAALVLYERARRNREAVASLSSAATIIGG
jgi:glucokinase